MTTGELVAVLRALSDARRFRMAQEVAKAGELTCGELGARFSLSQPTVSHHVAILLDAGVLVARRKGKFQWVKVNGVLLRRVAALLPARVLGS